jgi:hypothetical protein
MSSEPIQDLDSNVEAFLAAFGAVWIGPADLNHAVLDASVVSVNRCSQLN